MKKFLITFLLLIIFPTVCFGQANFVISEIMLNPEGSDSGREWIEVTNLGAGTGIDGFKFKEGATSTTAVSHGLKIPDGGNPSWLIGSNESFVIVSDPEKFYLDYPEYIGKIFDSSFSLNNSGEYLSILDSNKNILFEIDVIEEMIPEEGKTICLVESIWKNCNPSPGRLSIGGDVVSDVITGEEAGAEGTSDEDSSSNPNPNQGSDQSVVSKTFIEIKNPDYKEKVIKADGGGDRIVLAGSEFLFQAKSFGLLGRPLKDPKYRWNFGDGKTEKGDKALHVYHHPGEYNATLSVRTEKYSHVDRFKIKVIEPDLKISEVSVEKQFIKMVNNTKHDLDISSFKLVSGKIDFDIPENTFISSGNEITFPAEYIGIEIFDNSKIKLQTPNGKNIDVYEVEIVEEENVSSAQVPSEVPEPKHSVSASTPNINKKKIVKLVAPAGNVEEDAYEKKILVLGVSEDGHKDKENEFNAEDKNLEASVLKVQNSSFIDNFLYEIVFILLLLSALVVSVFFKRYEKSKKDKDLDEGINIKKEAKKYEIIEK